MAWTQGDSRASYDAVGVSVLLSPVASPRARACSSESEFYYTLVFPNTRVLSARSSRKRSQQQQQQQRVSYQDAVALLRAVTSGGKEREKRAIDELRSAWMRKFRATWPAPHDTVPFVYLQELLREVIVQRFDAIPGLFVAARVSADEELLLLSFRPSKALLAAKAEALLLKVPVAPALDPGGAYWCADPRRGVRESAQWDKTEAQEELYRLFLAGKIPADEAQLFDGENAAMWSRRIHALRRFADPHAAAAAAAAAAGPQSLPYKSRAALQYLYRSVETSASDDSSPFRVVDKIRLTKAIIDAEFDCDALVAQRILAHHFCTHTHHTDAVDTSIDVLRVQWGSLLSPWRLYRQRLAPLAQLLHFQPIVHVRNYFGEEIALYFAYVSFYAQALQFLCGAVLLLGLVAYAWQAHSAKSAPSDDRRRAIATYSELGVCLVNCAFVQVFVRKWAMRQRVLASDWGVAEHKSALHTRPQFRGELARSAITLRLEPHYSPVRRFLKRVVSYASLLVVSALLLFAYYRLLTTRAFESFANRQAVNVLLAVVIKCVAVPLAYASERLNDWENYKTQSDYDANLTLKFALLQTANNYGMLWYMAFVRPFASSNTCNAVELERSCRDQAAALLLAMLALDVALTLWELRGPLFELLVADVVQKVQHVHRSSRSESNELDELLEAERALAPYEGVLFDYAQVIGNFGFVTWFASLAPASCAVAWAVAVLQLRVDTFKLSHATQRPFPAQSSGIGSWLLYLRFLSLTSLLHNAVLAWLLWMERVAQPPVRLAHPHDLLVLAPAVDDRSAALLLTSETAALVIFLVCAVVWSVAGLPDQHDRTAAKQLVQTHEKARFLENKYVNSLDRVSDAVKDALPLGRVFLNGVHRYVITGNKSEEDAADELFDELRRRQLRVLDVDKRIAELRDARVGTLFVEVVRINILPVMDALTNAVDSFVQLALEAPAPASSTSSSSPPKARKTATKPANTSVVKKNRSPQWLEKFEFPLASLDDVLALAVFDWELLGKNRRIGHATLKVQDIVARTCATASESPTNRVRSATTAVASDSASAGMRQRASLIALVMGTFELPIELPEALRSALSHVDLVKHGQPRLTLRCGVQLDELGQLLVQRRRLHKQIASLKDRETRFVAWTDG